MSGEVPFLDPARRIPGLPDRTVCDFWRWAYSDVLSNRNRSVFAEFLVGAALGCLGAPRVEWDAADLVYRGFRIEVKSSAFCQSWHQQRPSIVRFGIEKARPWNPATGKYEGQATRCADVYVFCLYPEREKAKADPLDVPAWDFYVVPTRTLNREFDRAKSLSLAAVQRAGIHAKYSGLRAAVDWALGLP